MWLGSCKQKETFDRGCTRRGGQATEQLRAEDLAANIGFEQLRTLNPKNIIWV